MKCPICAQDLTDKQDHYSCPKGDGTLLAAKFLANKDLPVDEPAEQAATAQAFRQEVLTCPNCANTMHKVDYNSTGVIIDSCIKCPYRWLDAGEVDKIENFKPKLDAHDLLFLQGIQEEMRASKPVNEEDINAGVSSYNKVRNYHIVFGRTGSSSFTGPAVGLAFYGVVLGLIKSKFMRIAVPIVLIAVILIYVMVVKSF